MRLPLSVRIASGAAAVFLFSLSAPAGDKKNDDPDQIGNRKVDAGLNIYSVREGDRARQRPGASRSSGRPRSSTIPRSPSTSIAWARTLVRNSDAKVPFTIKVIDTEDVNAFALPGGFFYVNSGFDPESGHGSGAGRRDGA